MGARTDFEIRPEDDGFAVFAFTSWWGDDRRVRMAGGLACSSLFRTLPGAIDWVGLQFSVSSQAWTERSDGSFIAGKGEDLPERKTREHKVGTEVERQPAGAAI